MSLYASTRDALEITAKRIGIAFPAAMLTEFEQSPVSTLCTMVGFLDESQLFPAGMNIDPKLKLAMTLVSSCSFLSVLGSDAKKAFLLETSQQPTLANNLRNMFASQSTYSKYSGIAASMFVDAHDVNLMKVVLALEPLLERTEMLLSLGGDDRLTIDFHGTKINKYFSSTLPRAEMIRRGSCTCSTITWNDYHVAEELRYRLIHAVLTHATAHVAQLQTTSVEAVKGAIAQVIGITNDDIRFRLGRVLGLAPSAAEIVLFPSGSDAELLPLILALIRVQQTSMKNTNNAGQSPHGQSIANGCVYNYVTAAGEVGSGTPNAAGGRHFSPMSPKSSHPYPIFRSDVEHNTDDDSKRVSAPVSGLDAEVGSALGSITSSQPQVNNGLLRGWECLAGASAGSTDNKEGRSGNATVVVCQYKPRTSEGNVDFLESQLIADIRSKLGTGPSTSAGIVASEMDGRVKDTNSNSNISNSTNNSNNVCVLHVVCGSKTGLVCPSQVVPPSPSSQHPHPRTHNTVTFAPQHPYSRLLPSTPFPYRQHPYPYPRLPPPSSSPPLPSPSSPLNPFSPPFSPLNPQATVDLLQSEFGDRLIVVIDACQLRCHPHAVARYVDKGYLALVTASKFFTGPPFSGAVVVPTVCARELENYLEQSQTSGGIDAFNLSSSNPSSSSTSLSSSSSSSLCPAVPRGLSDYLTPHEVPATMPHLQVLPYP